jgi:hypothetical protein
VRSNQSLQRTTEHRGRTVRASMYARAGAEWIPYQAAELNRKISGGTEPPTTVMDANTFATSCAGSASRGRLLLGRKNVACGRGTCGRVAGVGGVALAAASQFIAAEHVANVRRRPGLVRSLTSNTTRSSCPWFSVGRVFPRHGHCGRPLN